MITSYRNWGNFYGVLKEYLPLKDSYEQEYSRIRRVKLILQIFKLWHLYKELRLSIQEDHGPKRDHYREDTYIIV